MRSKGDIPDYAEERTDDLMNTYVKIIANYEGEIDPEEVFRRLVNSPSERFWVSAGRAAIIISQIEKGDSLSTMGSTRREMFQEIYRRAQELKRQYPQMSIRQLALNVVMQPAPKFYLTPASARVIVCKARKRWFQKKNSRLARFRYSQRNAEEV